MDKMRAEIIVHINDAIRDLESAKRVACFRDCDETSLTLDDMKDIRVSLINYGYSIKHKDIIYPCNDRVEIYLARLNALCEKLDTIVKEQSK